MSYLNVFDDKVPFIVRDNLWNYCINSTYRLGWEDTDVPEKYDLNIHSHWSTDELESTDILPHIKKAIRLKVDESEDVGIVSSFTT